MSADEPRKPRARRRIAGERRPSRPGASGPGPTAPSEQSVPEADPRVDTPARGGEPLPAPLHGSQPAPSVPARDRPTAGWTGGWTKEAPSWLLVGVLGALALLLVLGAAVLGLGVWDIRQVRDHDRVQEATREAPAAAERASAAILSYGYTSLDADEKAAERYMSPKYRRKYAETFDRLVRPNAAKLKAKVEAEVKASGVAHADADRVNVLLYVNQTTTSTANGGEPQVALNRVQLSMVERDGRWLVDDITSY